MHPSEGKREQVTWISTFMHEDLLVEIFKRLPAKTLCRFRCISKGWNSLISPSFFINLHHHSTNSSATLRNGKLFLVVENVRFLGPSSYFLHPAQEKCLGLAKSFPFRHGDAHGRLLTYFYFVGVVHGVVCFSRSPSESGMVLWNPAIHKYIAVPPLPCLDMERYAIGFGYNRSRNDFKVVRIRTPLDGLGNNNLSSVYSSQEGQWRMASFDINVRCTELGIVSTSGCFVDGAIYWLLRAGIDVHIMLRFDCEREEFTTRELPREIFTTSLSLEHETRWGAELVVYGGMVSVVMERWLLKLGPGCEHWVDLWVMEEHGVTTTWNKLHTFVDGFESVGTDWRLCHKLNGRMRLNRSKIYTCNACRKHSELMNRHLYEESMFLMDDPNAESYAKNELVVIPR